MKRIIAVLLAALTVLSAASALSASAAPYSSFKKNPDYYYGIDVSSWNDSLDWNMLRDNGVDFAYIRVGYYEKDGGTLDNRFVENVKKCVEAGIEFGVYVYSYVYTKSDNLKCAKWVNKQLEALGNYTKDKSTIQVAYDIEDSVHLKAMSGTVSCKYMQQSVQKFCDAVKDFGYIPVVYSSESWFYNYLSIESFRENGVKIWYAQWPYYPDPSVRKIMFNNMPADVWQFSSSYSINGTVFDTNAMYTDMYDFKDESSTLRVSGIESSYTVSKNGVYPDIEVYDGDTLLDEDDYNVYYFHNDRVGRAKGKIVRYKNGKYFETKTFTFAILPGKIKNLGVSASNDSLTLKWDAVKGATSYRIYEYDFDDNTYSRIDEVSENYYEDNFLDEGTYYRLRVRAVHKIGGKNYFGKYKKVSAYTKYNSVKLESVDMNEDGALVTWTPRTDCCEGYQIQYSTDKSFKKDSEKLTVKDGTQSSAVIDIIDDDEIYYVRVRSYNIIDGEKVYSVYSKAVEV